MIDRTEVRLDLTPGKLYDYAPLCKDGKRKVQGVYRIMGVAVDARTRQELVVYEAVLSGIDRTGQWVCCSYMDFSIRFLPHQPVNGSQAEPKPPEKVLDTTIKGTGV